MQGRRAILRTLNMQPTNADSRAVTLLKDNLRPPLLTASFDVSHSRATYATAIAGSAGRFLTNHFTFSRTRAPSRWFLIYTNATAPGATMVKFQDFLRATARIPRCFSISTFSKRIPTLNRPATAQMQRPTDTRVDPRLIPIRIPQTYPQQTQGPGGITELRARTNGLPRCCVDFGYTQKSGMKSRAVYY